VEKLEIISRRESRNVIAVHTEIRGDVSVGDCRFGLTMLAVVVLEMGGEVSPLGEIWSRSQWGELYGVPGSSRMVL